MRKFTLRIIAALVVAFSATTAFAQSLPPLPEDPALVTGQLENGLTYYIRHNETPKNQADFYIAQKVGSILEDDHQRGLAHFLEHMCFNGTENFPGKNIINWLETVGVKFGVNLNAYTAVDQTVYNISNVPVTRQSVQDSCLLILHDWSCALTLDPAEIDAERGVIHEEWRQSMVGSMRILEKLLPTIYPDSPYGHRLPIGTMEVVDNFPAQALVDYYHKWYRPDQQAIIVVGDIDPAYIEAKIKEIFAPIPMPENAAERVYFPVEDTPGTIYAIGKDTEMQVPAVMMMFKSDDVVLPREYRNTQAYYPINYITTIISTMLNHRLQELGSKPDAEYAQARVSFGDFFLAKTKGAIDLEVYAKGGDVVPAFTQAYRELLRAAKGGFTVGEYDRAKAQFISIIERLYNERNDRQNDAYSKEYVDLFIDNLPAPGIEFEKQMYEQMANVISVDQINQYFGALISDDNRVLVALLPDAEGFSIPTEADFAAAVEGVDSENLEAYKDEMREDPLIPALPKAGKVKSTKHDKTWDATEYTLSNGVKVIVKPTDFKANEIVFEAIAKGHGLSTLDPAQAASIKFLPYAMQKDALYNYSNSDVRKYLQGKQVGVGFSASDYYRTVEGNSTVKDLPALMELIYAYFTGFDLKEDEFVANRDAMAGILANQESNPQYQFQRVLMKSLFDAPAHQALSSDDIKNANREYLVKSVREMLANAADYTFVFVGSIDTETFIPLMEQYIATLPANVKTMENKFVNDIAFELKAGSDVNTYTTKMETPQVWAFIAAAGEMPYNMKNKLTAQIAAQILSKRLLNKVREEMGATYSISANGDMDRTNKLNTIFQTAFPMKPEQKDEVLAVIKDMFNGMTQSVTAEELAPVVEYMIKSNEEALKENSDWAGSITATTLNGQQIFLGREEVLKSITPADVQNFMKAVLDQGNYRVITLDPEQ